MVVKKMEAGVEEIVEEVEECKYLGVWVDRKLQGNVQLEKTAKKAEEWIGKVTCMSRVNVQVEVDRGGMVWELLARTVVERRTYCIQEVGVVRDENGQEIVGGKKYSSTAQGDLGWRKLEERREEMKVMFGKRLEVLEVVDDYKVVNILEEWRIRLVGRV